MAGEGFNLGNATGYITIDTSGIDSAISNAQKSFSSGIQSIGSSISGFGSSVTTLFTPISIALGKATKDTLDFNEAITNIQAVTGSSADETKRLSDELLSIGQNSRAGPQAIAEAFYDIAGGVSDASVRMDTLKAALAASEAGSADLGSTVSALISIMNGYGFSADQAGHASDVLTQVVNKGVGTMDQFASALPNVAGLANSVGISFDDLGSMMAYLTTKGVSANEASTQLSGAISALIKPSKAMEDALKKIGFESGTAAIQQLGLVGTYEKLKESGADVNKITGPIEGLRGVIALTGGDFETFSGQFNTGLDGITEKTRAIQNASPAAQMEFFNSTISTLSITIGETLIPALNSMLESIMPIIQSVIDWVRQNPELTGQILLIVGALGVLGPILIAVGGAIGAIGGIIGFVLSPIGLIIAAVVGLYVAFKNNFLGIRDFLQPIIDRIGVGFRTLVGVIGNFGNIVNNEGIGTAIMSIVNAFAQMFGLVENDQMSPFLESIGNGLDRLVTSLGWFVQNIQQYGIVDAILGAFGLGQSGAAAGGESWVEGVLVSFGMARDVAHDAIISIGNFLQNLISFIQTVVIPGLQTLANWFLTEALPAVVNFVTTTVIPAIQAFFTFLGNAWAVIGPALVALADWFITTALPAIVNFITTVVIPGIQTFISTLVNIWTSIQPGLQALFDWFVTTALPAIVNFIQTTVIPGVQGFIDLLVNLWTQIQPGLQSLWDWFTVTALPAIINFIQTTVLPGVQGFIDLLVGIWTTIQPGLQSLWDWFTVTALPAIINFVQTTVIPGVQGFIDLLVGIWTSIQPGLQSLYDWFITNGMPFIRDIISGTGTNITNFINTLKGIWDSVSPSLSKLYDWFVTTGLPKIQEALQWFKDNVLTPVINKINELTGNTGGGALSSTSGINGLPGLSGGQQQFGIDTSQGAGQLANLLTGGMLGMGQDALHRILGLFGHDYPGPYNQNMAYMVGKGAQPEAFIPSTGGGGMAIPNFDQFMQQMMGGQGGVTFEAGSVVVNANSAAEGRQAAISFEAELRQRLAARGNPA